MSSKLNSLQLGMSWFRERAGGLDRYFKDLNHHLPGFGVSVRGLVMGSSAVQAESGGTIIAVAEQRSKLWVRMGGMRRGVASELRDKDVDVIASHFSLYTFPVLRLIRKKPMVVHFHGPYAAESSVEDTKLIANKAKLWMERTVYNRADLCITLSNAFADILHSSYRVPRERIVVVPGAVEAKRFDCPETRLQARERLGWPTGRPIVLCVRRLYRRMGLENLITAMKAVQRQVPDVLLLIGGRGWLADELQKMIEADSLGDNVRLLGFVPDVDLPVCYRAADFLVVPSISLEGFGLTTVESMAAGTPLW